MFLNTIRSNPGARKSAKRVGRGIGCDFGKTCGRGHKGQKSRSGGFHKIGFEGGQMPLYRRLPKSGFSSHLSRITAQINLDELSKCDKDVGLSQLKAAGLIKKSIKRVKIINSGSISKAVNISKAIRLTAGARAAVLSAGGKIEE